MKKLFTSIFILSSLLSAAQTPGLIWATQTGSVSTPSTIKTDASGNVISCGTFIGINDFDPSPGSFNLTSASGTEDIYVTKQNSLGNFIWAVKIGGSAGIDRVTNLAIDASGNVLLTGFFRGTVDFNPGAGVFNMTALDFQDSFVLKLDPNGNFIWSAGFIGGGNNDAGRGITVDAAGNVYIAGDFETNVDFDPSPTAFTLVSAGQTDGYIVKLNSLGALVWAKQITGTNSNLLTRIALDATGNPICTGYFFGTIDCDPGIGTFTVSALGLEDCSLIKLDQSGNFVFAKQFGGSGNDRNDVLTIDASGNIYNVGKFTGTSDFDPGIGTFTVVGPPSSYDIFINKLDASGNFVWVKTFQGANQESAYDVSHDSYGNIYVCGEFQGTVDFDPGPGVYTVTASVVVPNYDGFVFSLSSLGNFIWMFPIYNGGVASNFVTGNVLYTNGIFYSSCDFDPSPINFTLNPLNGNSFVQKLNICVAPSSPVNTTPLSNQNICESYTTNLMVTGSGTINWYATQTSTTVLGTGTNYTTPSLTAGTYTYYAEAATCTLSASRTPITVTVNPSPTITVNSGSICSGSSFTMLPSGANTYTYQGGNAVVSPTATTSYTILGTSSAGCVSTLAATSNVTVNPTPTVTIIGSMSVCPFGITSLTVSGASTYTWNPSGAFSSVISATPGVWTASATAANGCKSVGTVTIGTFATPTVSATGLTNICSGVSTTLTAIGASSYTWTAGPTTASYVVTPTTTTSYFLSGIDGNGCNDTAIINVNVNPLPVISANTSSSIICGPPGQQTATLTASGATSYTWNPGGAGASIAVSPSVTVTYTVTGIDANGCSNSSTFTQSVSTCAGFDSNAAFTISGVKVYPNPTNGILIIEINTLKENSIVEIYSTIGQLVMKEKVVATEQKLKLSHLTAGVYFVKVQSGNEFIIKKIIKE